MRLENRTSATEQGMAVARNLLAADEPYAPVPYFWTDQFAVKIQVYGTPGDLTVREGDPRDRRFAGRYNERGQVTGVIGWNLPKQARQLRSKVFTVGSAPSPSTGAGAWR